MGRSTDYSSVPNWEYKDTGYQTGAMVKYQGNIFIADFWAQAEPGKKPKPEEGWALYDELYDITTSNKTEQAKIIAYIPTWRTQENFDYRNPELYQYITHGIIAFLMFSEESPGKFEPKSRKDVEALLSDVVLTGHANDTKILIALGGATDYGFLNLMSAIGNNPENPLLDKAVKEVVEFIRSNSLDGVDLDLECWWDKNGDASKDQGGRFKDQGAHPAGDALTLFAQKLRQAMPDKLISIATFGTAWYGNNYNAKIADFVDWIGIMTYDLTGSWNSSPVGPHTALYKVRNQQAYQNEQQGVWPSPRAGQPVEDPIRDNPIFSVEDSLWYWTNPFFINWQGRGHNIPRNKVAAGVPIYGYDFAYAKEPDELTKQIPPGYKTIRYKDIVDQFPDAHTAPNANIKVPGSTARPAFTNTSGNYQYTHNIYFETPETAVAKLDFLKNLGTQGVIIWELSNEVWEDQKSIIRALYQRSGNPKKQPKKIELLPNNSVETDAKSPAVAVNSNGIGVKVYQKDNILFIRVGWHTEEGFRWLSQEVIVTDELNKNSYDGCQPSLALNDKGSVVLVWEGANDDDLFYRIGRAGASGFLWSGSPQKYGQGIRPYITLSNTNLIVETHQKGYEIWNQQLVYSTGMLSGGAINFQVQSVEYVKGREPSITVIEQDGTTAVVEVHMGDGALEKLWVRTGEVQPDGHINWWGSDVAYDTGKHSSIASTDDGYIVEVHRSDGLYAKLWYRVGRLDRVAKQVEWINQQAIAYATGEYPYVALAGNQADYILLEAHGADVFDQDLEDTEFPPDFVSMKGSIPLVHDLLEETGFYERVSVDLGSHGLCITDDGEKLYRCDLVIGPSRAQEYFDSAKIFLSFIPFIGDLISIVENSFACKDGETEGCVGVGIDAAFLAIDIIPGASIVKGTGKAISSVVEGVTRAARHIPIEDLFRRLDESDLSSLGKWFRKRQSIRANIDLPTHFPCLGLTKPSPRNISPLANAFIVNTDESTNLLMTELITPSQRVTAAVENKQIPALDLSDLLSEEGSKERLVEQYNAFIKGLRDDFNNKQKLEIQTFRRQITMGDKTLVLGFRKSDLYIVEAGTPGKVSQLREKETHYVDTRKELNVSVERIKSDFGELVNGKFATFEKGAIRGASEHLRLYAGLFSEAARFGVVRRSFAEILRFPGKSFDLAKVHKLLNNWDTLNIIFTGPSEVERKRVGIDDPEIRYSGDGHSYGSHFDGLTCDLKRR